MRHPASTDYRAISGRTILLASLLLPWWPAAAQQPDVSIEKRTNGVDADLPPGPILTIGDSVAWTYEVVNTSGRGLTNIEVSDDQGVVVSCPATVLDAGESMTCTGSGTVQAGQYANLGTVTADDALGNQVTDSDPSHYFGQAAPSIAIEKFTNGADADTPPGPIVPVGSAIGWIYEVTNVGSETLSNVEVTDDQGVAVSCPGTTLAAGEVMTCTAEGTALPGQYSNIGIVTAELPSAETTTDSDPSHYFGQVLLLEKSTNGQDADTPPGPALKAGDAITWSYEVTNPGPAVISNVAVTDDQGVIVTCPGTTLAAGGSMTCTGSGVAEPGLYANVGTATAELPAGGQLSASDPSHYFVNPLVLEKHTNDVDADLPPGPPVPVGAAIAWTYEVSNGFAFEITDIVVTDDQGVTVSCPATALAAGAVMTCTANGTAQEGQYANIGTVEAFSAESPSEPHSATDPSHYFGVTTLLDFGDAPDSYATLLASDGARHELGEGFVFLGACVDAELDGQPSASADGDDTSTGFATFGTCATTGDDEDGVTFRSPLIAGATVQIEVVASDACILSAWIDFNQDGDWLDGADDLFPGGTALVAGVNMLDITVPGAAPAGTTYARFRCTTDGPVGPTGAAADGEVEDYAVAVLLPAELQAIKTAELLEDNDGSGIPSAGDVLRYTVVISHTGGADATGVQFTDTPDPNTSLVNGSVVTSQGSVISGNTAEDGSVEVDLGGLGANASATIQYDVVIGEVGPTVREVINQGLVSADNLPADVLTDDPARPGDADPTVVELPIRIPTLMHWGLVLTALLLVGIGWRRFRTGTR